MAEKATMDGEPLPRFSKYGVVTQDYRAVVEELLKDIELSTQNANNVDKSEKTEMKVSE